MATQLPPTDEAFKQLSVSFGNYLLQSILRKKDEESERMASLLAVALVFLLFIYGGVETIKLVFRNNFGKKGLHLWKALLAIFAFGLIAYLAFDIYQSYDLEPLPFVAPKNSFLYTAIFYAILTLFLSIKLGVEFRKRVDNNHHDSYRGDSTILGFLEESGWEQSKIQNAAEPLLILAIGIFLSPLNLLLGIPLIICALSFWIHYAYESLRGLLEVRNELSDNKGYSHSSERKFSKIIN
ncbi:MAG: hypothetical protein AB8G86_04780 [Saprospiraceae bacterium]